MYKLLREDRHRRRVHETTAAGQNVLASAPKSRWATPACVHNKRRVTGEGPHWRLYSRPRPQQVLDGCLDRVEPGPGEPADKTLVDVDGHTDSTGSPSHNQGLSERRAASVANYLATQGVDQRRMSAIGYGQDRPIASNATEAGRAQNRRVEISIAPIREG